MSRWLAENPQGCRGHHRHALDMFVPDDRSVRSACSAYDSQEQAIEAACLA